MGNGRFALLIATSEYDDEGLRSLTAPPEDVSELSVLLKDPLIGNFDVVTKINESSHVIIRTIEDFFADREPDDLLLLYFSGHGLRSDTDFSLYLATTDTMRTRLRSTSVPAAFINEVMRHSFSRRQLLLLDCCYSGLFAKGLVAKNAVIGEPVDAGQQFKGSGRIVITATDSLQFAFEGESIVGEAPQSLFTSIVVSGLKTGGADVDGDGDISANDLYKYVHDKLKQRKVNQTPKRWEFELEGDLIIARAQHDLNFLNINFERSNSINWKAIAHTVTRGHGTAFLGPGLLYELLPRAREQFAELAREDFAEDASQQHLFLSRILEQQPLLEARSREVYSWLANLSFTTYIVTSYDRTIEIELKNQGKTPNVYVAGLASARAQRMADYSNHKRASVDTPSVIYLYGVVDQPQSLVLNDDDRQRFLLRFANDNARFHPLAEALAGSAQVWLGLLYSDQSAMRLTALISSFAGAALRSRYFHCMQVPKEEPANFLQATFGHHLPRNELLEKLPPAVERIEQHAYLNRFGVYWGTAWQFLRDLTSYVQLEHDDKTVTESPMEDEANRNSGS